MDVTVRLLGPLEVRVDGHVRDLGPPKQRALLALLAVFVGRVVSTDRLVDELWGGEAPESPSSTLQVYVSRLRRSLAPAGGPRADAGSGTVQGTSGQAPSRVLRRPPGYLLDLPVEAVDAPRVSRLLAAGQAELELAPVSALGRLDEALALVVGAPLADTAERLGHVARAEVARLEELVLRTRETRLEALLRCGQAEAAAGEVAVLAGLHPLREGLQATRVLVLYRTGRQAEALAAYEQVRRELDDVLGVDPGPALRRLQAQVLRHDPALDLVPAPATEPYQVVRPQAPAVAAASRQPDADRLDAALARAAAGSGSVILVGGEPGIGKTWLCDHTASRAGVHGLQVVRAHAHESASAAPFWPWREALRALPDVPTDGPVAVLLGNAAPPAGTGPAEARAATYEAVTRLLLDRADRAPLLLVVEDVHWADEPTLEQLAVLAERSGSVGLVVVASYRSGQAAPASPLGALLARLARLPHVVRVDLRGLPERELVGLMASRATVALDDAVAMAAARRSDGNPFFALELARWAQDGPGLDPGQQVPGSVRDVLLRRTSLLRPVAQRVLEVASVVGRECELALLVVAGGLPLEEVDDALGVLVDAGLVTERMQPRPAVRFVHALVREAVYGALRPIARARLHAAVGLALATGDSAPDPDDVAAHLAEGVEVVGAAMVLPALLTAADAATGRLAYEHAERVLQRALPVVLAMPAGTDRDGFELAVRARRGSLLAARLGWSAPAAAIELQRAQVLAEHGEPDVAVFAAVYGMSAAHTVAAEFAAAMEIGRTALRRSRRPGPAAEQWCLLGSWICGVVHWHLGDPGLAVEHLERAVAVADRLGGSTADAFFHDAAIAVRGFLAVALTLQGRRGEALRSSEEALRRAEESGNPFDTCSARFLSSLSDAAAGDLDRARWHGGVARQTGQAYGFGLWALLAGQVEGWALAVGGGAEGDRAGGLQQLRSSYAAYVEAGPRMLRTVFLGLLGEAEQAQGNTTEARTAVGAGLRLADQLGEGLWRDRLERLRLELGPAG